jgi:hypothetical protein
VTDIALPEGTITLFKKACHEAIIAAGGRKRVAFLLGVDESFLSRACLDRHPEKLSRDHMLLLGVSGGGAAFADFFASFAHCHVVRFDDNASSAKDELIAELGAIAKEQSEATAALAEVALRSTPAAARKAIKEFSDVSQGVDQILWKLATVVAKGT